VGEELSIPNSSTKNNIRSIGIDKSLVAPPEDPRKILKNINRSNSNSQRKTENRNGSFIGITLGGAVGGGLSLKIGVVTDSKGNSGLAISFNSNFGFGGENGIETNIITPTHEGQFLLDDYAGRSLTHNAGFSLNGTSLGSSYGGSFNEDAGFTIKEIFFSPENVTGTSSLDRGYKEIGISGGLESDIQFGWTISQGKTYLWDF